MRYEFKEGDRVRYNLQKTGLVPFSTDRAGALGTVKCDKITNDPVDGVQVMFDVEGSILACAGNLTIINISDEQSEINNALAVLKKYGKVEFKKNKPPFVNKTVRLNSSYSAEVNEFHIQVGCQNIPFAAIDELAEAVAIARKYNEEK